jgi:Ni/Fe-hydrogenase subunit HybB-like protein
MFNRLNVCILALNWESDAVYRPKWSEYVVSLTLITIGVLIFRAVVNRMPILYTFPEYRDEH